VKLTRVEYTTRNGRPILYLFLREDKNRKLQLVTDFRPYFYVPADVKDATPELERDEKVYKAVDGKDVVKVYTALPEDVPVARMSYEKHYEADVLFSHRWLIDQPDKLEPVDLKIMFIDIETDNKSRVPDAMTALESIIAISVEVDDTFTTFVWRDDQSTRVVESVFTDCLHQIRYFNNEREMLSDFIEFVANESPDLCSGWFAVKFDLPYIINRCALLNIKYNRLSPMFSVYLRDTDKGQKDVVIKGVSIVDLYDAYKKFSENLEESYKLDYIGKKVAGIGKIGNAVDSIKSWRDGESLDTLIQYNINDVNICYRVNQKMQLLEFVDELRRTCFCQHEDCMSATRMIDAYILRLFSGKLVFPSKEHLEHVDYEGAIVENFGNGLFEWVSVGDLKSLYPSIICSLNLSSDTMQNTDTGNCYKIGKFFSLKSPEGYLPFVVRTLLGERARYKSLMKKETLDSPTYKMYEMRQKAYKTLANAVYGQTSFTGSRIQDQRVAEAITWTGRQIDIWSKERVEDMGHKVVYMDTDSVHFCTEGMSISDIEDLLFYVNCTYDDFVKQFGDMKQHIFQMEFEKVYRRVFYAKGAKKRYAGWICWYGGKPAEKLEVRGIEIRRSDSSRLTKSIQQKIFDMVLRENLPKQEVLDYVKGEVKRVEDGNYTFTEIGIPKGINKSLYAYGKTKVLKDNKTVITESVPAHIRGAMYSKNILQLDLTDKPKLLYIKTIPKPYSKTDVLCFDEDEQVPAGTVIDIDKMLDKTVRDKIEQIFEGLGWKVVEAVWYWIGKKKRMAREQIRMLE
jgi:DNA polymerase I